jgi:hypothetical protein
MPNPSTQTLRLDDGRQLAYVRWNPESMMTDETAREMALLAGPWGFRPSDVHLPVLLWQGSWTAMFLSLTVA